MSAVREPHAEFMPMGRDDIDEVMAIELRVCPFPWSRGNFSDSLKSGYNAWVCRVDGELAGYFVTMLTVDEGHLLNIVVAPNHQGVGIGARLLQQAMQVALAGGMHRLLLEVRPSNDKALTLYRHYGFKQIGMRRGYYPAGGGQREDALVLVRELAKVTA